MRAVIFICFLCYSSYGQDVSVNAYFKSDGTVVEPHFRTAPNETMYDNYSTIGNVNPYTGKAGTVIPTSNSYSISIPTYYPIPSGNADYSYLKPATYIPDLSNSKHSEYVSDNTPKMKTVPFIKGGKYFQRKGTKKSYIKQSVHQ